LNEQNSRRFVVFISTIEVYRPGVASQFRTFRLRFPRLPTRRVGPREKELKSGAAQLRFDCQTTCPTGNGQLSAIQTVSQGAESRTWML
jgi:hypothetical protein